MYFRIAMYCEKEGGGMTWLWLSEVISDPAYAEQQLNVYAEKYQLNEIDFAESDTEAGLTVWIMNKNSEPGTKSTKGATKKCTTDAAREKMEIGKGGDNKEAYLYTSPVSWKEQKAWMGMNKQHNEGLES